ncbi:MAG TPA: hypothetical protein VKG22_01705 [Stellaceae bacterium]|nr:hypothetical protein [Stellaceae bacterium]HMD65348.1 hypothetical protein [Stellaceae bacterium]
MAASQLLWNPPPHPTLSAPEGGEREISTARTNYAARRPSADSTGVMIGIPIALPSHRRSEVKLNRSNRQIIMLDRHDHAILMDRRSTAKLAPWAGVEPAASFAPDQPYRQPAPGSLTKTLTAHDTDNEIMGRAGFRAFLS